MTPGLAAAVLAAAGAASSAEPAARVAALQSALEHAVARVGPPRALAFVPVGAEAVRAIRLPGYGLVVVLPPRALPGSGQRVVWRARTPGPASSPRSAPSEADVRRRVEAALAELRAAEQTQGTSVSASEAELRRLRIEIEAFRREAARARRAAEEELQRTLREVRFEATADGNVAVVHTPRPPEPPVPPDPPSAPEPPVTEPSLLPPVPSRPVGAPAAPAPPALPATPPWVAWFEEDVEDGPGPDRLVAQVRDALVETLARHGTGLQLGPEESVAVSVEFRRGGLLASGRGGRTAPRTLLVRARAKDLEAVGRGLSLEELKRRIEVSED